MLGLSGGRRLALEGASSDPTARKWGNTQGAKGPDRKHLSVDMEGELLEQKFHYRKSG